MPLRAGALHFTRFCFVPLLCSILFLASSAVAQPESIRSQIAAFNRLRPVTFDPILPQDLDCLDQMAQQARLLSIALETANSLPLNNSGKRQVLSVIRSQLAVVVELRSRFDKRRPAEQSVRFGVFYARLGNNIKEMMRGIDQANRSFDHVGLMNGLKSFNQGRIHMGQTWEGFATACGRMAGQLQSVANDNPEIFFPNRSELTDNDALLLGKPKDTPTANALDEPRLPLCFHERPAYVEQFNRLRPDSFLSLTIEDLQCRNAIFRQIAVAQKAMHDVPVPLYEASVIEWQIYFDAIRPRLAEIVELRKGEKHEQLVKSSKRFGPHSARIGRYVLEMIAGIDYAKQSGGVFGFRIGQGDFYSAKNNLLKVEDQVQKSDDQLLSQAQHVFALRQQELSTGRNLSVSHKPQVDPDADVVALLRPETQAALTLVQFWGNRIPLGEEQLSSFASIIAPFGDEAGVGFKIKSG